MARPGDRILLTGANGAGKTTLLRMLATLARPSAGRIHWQLPARSADSAEPDRVRRHLGYAAHHPLLWDELTGWENLRFAFRLHRVDDPDRAALQAAREWGVAERLHDRVGALSRGLKQRVALARAFGHAPGLLLLDEPGNALDATAHETLLRRLEAAGPQTTVVLATHRPDPYGPWATRRWRLGDARLDVGEEDPA